MMQYRRQYQSREERWLPLSNRKSFFSRLLQRSEEVLALYSNFHSVLSRGGMLINRGSSFICKCTVLPYFESEHGVLQEQPYFLLVSGHRYLRRCFLFSQPSRFILLPAGHIGTPSSPKAKSSLYIAGLPRLLFMSMNGTMVFLLKYL